MTKHNKGWKNEPTRHGLASKGIKTTMSAKGIFSPHSDRVEKLLVEEVLPALPDEEIKTKVNYFGEDVGLDFGSRKRTGKIFDIDIASQDELDKVKKLRFDKAQKSRPYEFKDTSLPGRDDKPTPIQEYDHQKGGDILLTGWSYWRPRGDEPRWVKVGMVLPMRLKHIDEDKVRYITQDEIEDIIKGNKNIGGGNAGKWFSLYSVHDLDEPLKDYRLTKKYEPKHLGKMEDIYKNMVKKD